MGYVPKKTDRDACAERMQRWAETNGVGYSDERDLSPRKISVTLSVDNYRCLIHISGHHEIKGTGWLGHWHTRAGSKAVYPRAFPNVNTITYGKATTYADSLDHLLEQFTVCVEMLRGTGNG